MAAFITILTETLPAGLLPQMALGFAVSDAMVGQFVTSYAMGSLVAAIPLVIATQNMRRRPVLLAALAGFGIANMVTTLSSSYVLTLGARFLAGVSAGLVWALLAGYAARMVPQHLEGRAIAVAMVGTPLALSLGVPAGTFLGNQWGWRICFGIMSLSAVLLMLWVQTRLPDFAGQTTRNRRSFGCVFFAPGIRPILVVILGFVLSHNILYTYIAPFLAGIGMLARTDLVLLIFGVASLFGIWVVGALIDQHLRTLTLVSTLLFAVASLGLSWSNHQPLLIYAVASLWGLAVGGAATLFQTALFRAAGDAADIAQSMAVTVWNVAIAGGGLVGGMLLDRFSAEAFSPALLTMLIATALIVWITKKHSFPPSQR